MPDMRFSVGTAAAPPGLMTLPLTSQQVSGSTCCRSAASWLWLCVVSIHTRSPSTHKPGDEGVRSSSYHHRGAILLLSPHGEGVNVKIV